MSPAWPTVKVVSEPAGAPSVFELSDDGVDASCVIWVMSNENVNGVAEPFGVVSASVMLPGVLAPAVVSYLPAVLNFSGVPPVSVGGPSGLVSGPTVQGS